MFVDSTEEEPDFDCECGSGIRGRGTGGILDNVFAIWTMEESKMKIVNISSILSVMLYFIKSPFC